MIQCDFIFRTLHLISFVIRKYWCNALALLKFCNDNFLICWESNVMISTIFLSPLIFCGTLSHTKAQCHICFWCFYRNSKIMFTIKFINLNIQSITETAVPAINIPTFIISIQSIIFYQCPSFFDILWLCC